jgi:[NiFe] hydrogenase diaphorase moiety small subunit
MTKVINFSIDGTNCIAEKGQYILDAAKANNIYIPTLCNLPGIKPRGSCRICNVKVNGKLMTSCTTPVSEGMQVENNTDELLDLRKAIVELLFVEGNHYCPFCEKSGNCELQALAYRFKIMVPRYPYQFPDRDIEASSKNLIKDHNRCILCKRCIRAVRDENGHNIFAFKRRGYKVVINVDSKISGSLNDELAQKAMDICPVGALIKKEQGFNIPIGKRTYDNQPIGHEFDTTNSTNF